MGGLVAELQSHGRAAVGWLLGDDGPTRQELAGWQRTITAIEAADVRGLPAAAAGGDLPAGIHAATWGEFNARFGGSPARSRLLAQLRPALDAMHGAGVPAVVIGGSFVTGKVDPNDIDMGWLARDDVHPLDVRRAIGSVGEHDIQAFRGYNIVDGAADMPGARAGVTFIELFQLDKAGARRGAVLLSTTPERILAGVAPGQARASLVNAALSALRAVTPG